jgi:hypothetical protein
MYGYNTIVPNKLVLALQINDFLQEKAVEATKQKEEKRKKSKPEKQEGMPPHQHCPP